MHQQLLGPPRRRTAANTSSNRTTSLCRWFAIALSEEQISEAQTRIEQMPA
jgi:hypothetical protein